MERLPAVESLPQADQYLLYSQNITPHMPTDEVRLSHGELYTILSLSDRLGRSGKVAAVIRGTKAGNLIKVLALLPEALRETVKEVTLNMSTNMIKATQWAFSQAVLVTDRFHVKRLCADAVQQERIDQRWKENYREAKAIIKYKKQGTNSTNLHTNQRRHSQASPGAISVHSLFDAPTVTGVSNAPRLLTIPVYPSCESNPLSLGF